jgi:hypothetical protein
MEIIVTNCEVVIPVGYHVFGSKLMKAITNFILFCFLIAPHFANCIECVQSRPDLQYGAHENETWRPPPVTTNLGYEDSFCCCSYLL